MMTNEHFLVGAVLISFLLLVGLVSGETASATGNVTLSCNNASSCVLFGPGNVPLLFTAVEYNTTYHVTLSVEYEKNITVFPNVTIVNNVTNVTYTTTTVNVTDCTSIPAATATVDTQAIINGLNAGLAESCRSSCEAGGAATATVRSELDACRASESTIRSERDVLFATTANAQNLSDTRYDALNATIGAQLAQCQNEKLPWMILSIIALLLFIGFLAISYNNGRRGNGVSGLESAPPLHGGDQ